MSDTPVTEMHEEVLPDHGLRYRYACYRKGDRLVRHGEFRAFYKDGTIASEGSYVHGREDGPWKDFHDNGKLAADGAYRAGRQHGTWKYFDIDGTPEETVEYADGVEVKKAKKRARAAGPQPEMQP